MPRDTGLPPWASEAVDKLKTLYPGFEFGFTYHKHDQIQGACPFPRCRTGTDRLVVFENGNVWCRECKEQTRWRIEAPSERADRQAYEQKVRERLREQIATCKDWQAYHDNVGQFAHLWKACGIEHSDIAKWGLGYCHQTPNVDYESASLTIPVFYQQKLVDIRHRLISPRGEDKYRSHLPQLPPSYWGMDSLQNQGVCYFTEGEKKAIVVAHNGLSVASYPGYAFAYHLPKIISQTLAPSQVLVFLPDPGTQTILAPTLAELRGRGYKVKCLDLLNMKPDDFIMRYGQETLQGALEYARWY